VSEAEEWARLDPVLRELARRIPHTPISVDTVKRGIAARALDAGAWAINDVSGLRLDLGIADVCAKAGAGLIVMHSRGTVSNMATYDHAHYADVSAEVAREIGAGVALAEGRGVPRDAIVVDPGLGFAKETAHSYAALNGVTVLAATGQPVMVGPSRKRFLGAATGAGVLDRDGATAAACAAAFLLGARLFRVHAVRPVVEALSVVHAIRAA
jgi:dihydropteroate synthase